jgi:hypothetical protein
VNFGEEIEGVEDPDASNKMGANGVQKFWGAACCKEPFPDGVRITRLFLDSFRVAL